MKTAANHREKRTMFNPFVVPVVQVDIPQYLGSYPRTHHQPSRLVQKNYVVHIFDGSNPSLKKKTNEMMVKSR